MSALRLAWGGHSISMGGGLQLRAAALLRRTMSGGHAAVLPRARATTRQHLHPVARNRVAWPSPLSIPSFSTSAASSAASSSSLLLGSRLFANNIPARFQFRVGGVGRHRLHTSARTHDGGGKGGGGGGGRQKGKGYWQNRKAMKKGGGGGRKGQHRPRGGGGGQSQAMGRGRKEEVQRFNQNQNQKQQSGGDFGFGKQINIRTRVLEPNPERDAILATNSTVDSIGSMFSQDSFQRIYAKTRLLKTESIVSLSRGERKIKNNKRSWGWGFGLCVLLQLSSLLA